MEKSVTAAAKTTLSEKPKRGLGRGLDALFGDAEQKPAIRNEKIEALTSEISSTVSGLSSQGPRTLPITALIPTPFQPRKTFAVEDMTALVNSIRMHGILQPLIVRAAPGQDSKYEIIAGERRWRAAQQAQLHEVPVIIKSLDDRQTLEIALIENIQRADLTPIEEAEGYQRLMTEFGHTQEELSNIVGKSRSHMSNIMRLLQLPERVRDMVARGDLPAGAARILVGLDKAETIAQHALRKRMSVRQLERFVARLKRPPTLSPLKRMTPQKLNDRKRAKRDGGFSDIDYPMPKDADVLALEAEMGALLGLKIDIQSATDGSGVLGVYFSSLDQLDELLQKMAGVKG